MYDIIIFSLLLSLELFILLKILQSLCRYLLFGKPIHMNNLIELNKFDAFLEKIRPLILFILYGRFVISYRKLLKESIKYKEKHKK
jgi:hypothetical protein